MVLSFVTKYHKVAVTTPATRNFARMPKRFIKRYLPEPHKVKEEKCFQFLGDRLHDPNLWHLNRHSVSGAVAVGLFVAFILVPFQTIIAAMLAIYFRVNLPISIVLIWISNPLTIAPIFLGTVKLGEAILGLPCQTAGVTLSWEWLSAELMHVWKPLIVGSLAIASVASLSGYIATQYFWRRFVLRRYKNRHKHTLRKSHPS